MRLISYRDKMGISVRRVAFNRKICIDWCDLELDQNDGMRRLCAKYHTIGWIYIGRLIIGSLLKKFSTMRKENEHHNRCLFSEWTVLWKLIIFFDSFDIHSIHYAEPNSKYEAIMFHYYSEKSLLSFTKTINQARNSALSNK